MANPWFRLYAEFATDPKVQVLSETLQRRYVMALCLRCNGPVTLRKRDEIALFMRITMDEWDDTLREFIERGLFDEYGEVKNWDKRQYISDLKDTTAAERQRRYRQRQKGKVAINGNGNANRDVTASLRPDTDTDTDTEEKNIPPISPAEKKTNGCTWHPPAGINLQAWNEFEIHRKEIKKPLTDLARIKAANLLLKYPKTIQAEIIDKSIRSRWSGLFPEKVNLSGNGGKSAASRFIENLKNA